MAVRTDAHSLAPLQKTEDHVSAAVSLSRTWRALKAESGIVHLPNGIDGSRERIFGLREDPTRSSIGESWFSSE